MKDHIRAHGPLSVSDYMRLCLGHPEHGYYMTKEPFGIKGDFTTAPEISQIFGELIGAWLAECWNTLGRPAPCLLAELGPGRGTLIKDALRATRGIPGFHNAIRIHLVETSSRLTAIQNTALRNIHPRIHWHAGIGELPDLPLLLIANEMFDALPVNQYTYQDGWQERCIAIDNDTLTWYTRPTDAPWLRWLPAKPGDIAEHSPEQLALMQRIATHIGAHGGAALIIDYGYASGHGDTLQAVRAHEYADPLKTPGQADLTAHVDFAALKNAASSYATVHGPVEQGAFLKRLGAELRATALCRNATPAQRESILSGLERLVSPHEMGIVFKALAVTSFTDTPAGF